MLENGERDFTKYMFLDQHPCWSWNNIPINQSELKDNFSGNICFRLTIRVRCFYTLVNQLSFHTDFRNKLWVGLGLGVGIWLSLYFWTVMLIQEHVLLGKITVTAREQSFVYSKGKPVSSWLISKSSNIFLHKSSFLTSNSWLVFCIALCVSTYVTSHRSLR